MSATELLSQSGQLATFIILAVLGVGIFVAAPWIMRLFTPDAAVVQEGARFLRWVAPTFGFMGVVRAYTGGFRGAGKVLTAAAISITMLGFVRLPVAWLGAQYMGPDGIWLAFAVSNVVAAVIAILWFQPGSWREADITDDGHGPAARPSDD